VLKRPRLCLFAVIAVLAGFLVARAAHKAHGVLEDNRLFAARLLDGELPYAGGLHAPYPPAFGVVMAPLLLLPITASRVAWALLQLLLLLLLWRLLSRCAADLPAARAPPWLAFAGALLLGSRFLLRDMQGGGGNLVFGTLALFACLRPGEAAGLDRRWWRGIGLGVVLAAKPTPVLLLPWLWWRGRKRTCAAALGTALLLHAAPLCWLSVDTYLQAYGRWLHGTWLYMTQQDLFAPPAFDFPRFSWMHQSLRYCLARWLGCVPEQYARLLPWFVPGLGLGAAVVAWVIRAVGALLLAASLLRLWSVRHSRSPWVDLGGAALLVCLTLLLSPITWKAHHVQLLPVFFLLLLRGGHGRGLLVYFVLCTLLSHEVVGDAGEELLASCYLVTFGALWLWALLRRGLAAAEDQ